MLGYLMLIIVTAKNACLLMSNLYSILAEWHPDGDFTESDLWDAIAESEGVDVNSIMDGDLTEYL